MLQSYRNPNVTYFARTNFRNGNKLFGIKQPDRLMHTYLIGKTGTGKSTCMETMLLQDIQKGRGLCLLDPHGDLVEKVYRQISKYRREDLIHFNIPDENLKLKYNPLRKVQPKFRSLVASGMLEVFSKLWSDAWGVKLEHILRHAILTVLDQPDASIEHLSLILLDDDYRTKALRNVQNASILRFWEKEYPDYRKGDLMPVLNKIGSLLVHPVIHRVLVSNPKEISLRKAMDSGKIVLINLSKGHLGSDVAQILGALFMTSLSSAAISRASSKEESRRPFMIYMDEFHNFTTKSLVDMFAELRKYKVGLIIAHQFLHQLDDSIRRAVLGNIGTIISFRIGTEDAYILSKEMFPKFEVTDIINLPNYDIYLKLLIDGKPSTPFSACTVMLKDLRNG